MADHLFDIADGLERKRLCRFADQLIGTGMSMSNYIEEGSGSRSDNVFIQYLEYAGNSAFVNVNIAILMNRRGLISKENKGYLLEKPDKLCKNH